jgi:hypothetical protein
MEKNICILLSKWLHVLRALSLGVHRCSHCLEIEMLMSMYR